MNAKKHFSLEEIVAYLKRRGFVYQSSEIYGGFAAVYDYGPYGIELKKAIQEAWWQDLVHQRKNVVGLDSAIFMDPKTWQASGHVESFHDPLVECRDCHLRMRADHLLEDKGINVDRAPLAEVNEHLEKLKNSGEIKCSNCGSNNFTEARVFNLLVKSNLGSPVGDLSEDDVVYLRGETCQGIYLNYKNVRDSMRLTPPFGIAQVGKAFRNEIVARQFIFRTREFEQMEFQYFVKDLEKAKEDFEYWRQERLNWYKEVLKIDMAKVRIMPHERLAHYAHAAEDIEYDFDALGGFKELEGLHIRGGEDYDIGAHAKASGKNLYTHDQESGDKYIPYIVETAAGLNRIFLLMIAGNLCVESLEEGDERTVLKIPKRFAPVKAAILPLQKKPEELVAIADKIYEDLSQYGNVEYDLSGSIGKRYRRQDEIGTPYCITIDHDTIEDNTVTIRDRDTMQQKRVKIDELRDIIF